MFINKIGYDHSKFGINNQDFGFEIDKFKCVVDGCSKGINGEDLHSEVGAKLFCYLLKDMLSKRYTEHTFNGFPIEIIIDEIFGDVLTSIFAYPKDICDYILFTILVVKEEEDNFKVYVYGDGNIILEKHNGDIDYLRIGEGNTPNFYAYNYIPQNYLVKEREDISFKIINFSKKEFKNIGIATDGLDYLLKTPYKILFENYLREKKEFYIRRLINREHKSCKDDITIVF